MHKGFKKWDVPGLHQNSVTSSAPPNNNISQKPTLVALLKNKFSLSAPWEMHREQYSEYITHWC